MKTIWITWEKQRRSIELSNALKAKYFELLQFSSQIPNRLLRYYILSIKTIKILFKEKPDVLFCQNPSIILALLLCIAKLKFRYRLIVDRHSNFKLDKSKRLLKYKIFNIISDFTIKQANLTIITNKYLYELVESKGGRGFILEDKLPDLKGKTEKQFNGEKIITYISTYSEDEPIKEVIRAANYIKNTWIIYITGNYTNYKYKHSLLRNLPDNVRITGFLPDEEYQGLLKSSNIIMVLTTMDYTLTCGAYEGVSLNKPLILSNTDTIKAYFNKGAVYSQNNAHSICRSIYNVIEHEKNLCQEVEELKEELLEEWNEKFKELSKQIYNDPKLQN